MAVASAPHVNALDRPQLLRNEIGDRPRAALPGPPDAAEGPRRRPAAHILRHLRSVERAAEGSRPGGGRSHAAAPGSLASTIARRCAQKAFEWL